MWKKTYLCLSLRSPSLRLWWRWWSSVTDISELLGRTHLLSERQFTYIDDDENVSDENDDDDDDDYDDDQRCIDHIQRVCSMKWQDRQSVERRCLKMTQSFHSMNEWINFDHKSISLFLSYTIKKKKKKNDICALIWLIDREADKQTGNLLGGNMWMMLIV